MKRNAYFFSLILLAMTGCIGTDFVDEPLGPVPSRLELSHASLILLEGESQQLSAQVIASDESVLDEPVTWMSRDAAIASVNATGLLTAVAAGQVWIEVSTQSLEDSILVTVSVDQTALASITISGSQTEIAIGDTLQLGVALRNASGDPLTGKVVSWESASPATASVDENGLVTALANGTTQITAFSEGLKSLPFALMVGADSFARTGTFVGVNGYSVQGTAILERTADKAELTLDDDFRSQNGPGLYVYLSPNAGNVSGGVNLGQLKATSGLQRYEIPGNVNSDDFGHVLIYCQPFGVPFGTAPLQ